MNRFSHRYPSPSLVISLLALVISLGGAGYAANGGSFILGRINVATAETRLSAPFNGRTLRLINSSTQSEATALSLLVAAGRTPFTVNSATKVSLLNADQLDGLDSTQFANKLVIPFNLAAGAITAQIVVPPNQPVFVMGISTTPGYRGVGQVTLLRTPENSISWTGLESHPVAITSGQNYAAGTHIVFIDSQHYVDIEVNGPNTIQVHNGGYAQVAGTVTLIW